jgi:quinol-cytochrome oxidoreductase complex cytochrome b subunit
MKKPQFSYYEKRSMVSMTAMLAVYIGMFYDSSKYYQLQDQKQELLNFWGGQFLVLFLFLVQAHAVAMVVFHLLNKRFTGEENPKIKDERDNAIELKAVSAGHYTLALGVFVAMLTAMWAHTYSPIFFTIMGSFLASGIVADIVRIVSYRKSS